MVLALPACTPKPEGPGARPPRSSSAALSVGDTATAAQLSDDPNEAREALNAAWAGLQATHLDAQVLSSKYAEDMGTVVLPLHLASTQEPDVELRRSAEDGPRRGALAGSLDDHRAASQTGGAPDVRAALRAAPARVGE